MNITATITRTVDVDPTDVIEKLIFKEIGNEGFIFKKDKKYYIRVELSRMYSEYIEITKDKYKYIRALKLVLKTLKQK